MSQVKTAYRNTYRKLASAAQNISFAKTKPSFRIKIDSGPKINSEAKVRRSTRSVVLGKAKVMNHEDLEGTSESVLSRRKLPRARESAVLRARVLRQSQR